MAEDPNILTAPLTFSLWEHEVEFYEAMQKLYKMRNAKVGDKGVAKVVDTFSLSAWIRRGWPRAIPLHLLIGINYLKPLLALSPMGLWMVLDTPKTYSGEWRSSLIFLLVFQ